MCKKLGLSFQTTKELNDIIDKQLPGRPAFKWHEIVVDGQCYETYLHNIIECIKTLYSNPKFAPFITYSPTKLYVDETKEVRMFHQFHTGDWWWRAQVSIMT